jgi:hypothetical protein
MLETRPQVERSSAKPGCSWSCSLSDCFSASCIYSSTSARFVAPRASAPTQRAYQPAGLELGKFVTRQVCRSAGSKVGKPGGWVAAKLRPCVRAGRSLAGSGSEKGRGLGHGHASQRSKWCGIRGIEQRTARNALNVRASRCYQSEQRMHISPAAGPGAPGPEAIGRPPCGARDRPMLRTSRQVGT